jgi:hypothetical protein
MRAQAFESTDDFGAIEWDDFLLEVIGTRTQPVPPLQPNVFSETAQINELHTNPRVVIQTPKRVMKSVGEIVRQEFLIKDYERGQADQAEVLCRTDFKIVELESLGVFSARSEEYGSVGTIAAARDYLPRCPKCGLTTCPTADPGSTLACTNSGV